jgi:Phage terminase large subunit
MGKYKPPSVLELVEQKLEASLAEKKQVQLVDMTSWKHIPKIQQLIDSPSPRKMAVGGTGSGKSAGILYHLVCDYALRWNKCDILCLRKTFPDLERGLISDFKTYIPEEIYKFNDSKKVATLVNGSRIFFSHLASGSERDLLGYQGSSFPAIFIDECGQFSLDAFNFLQSRNRVNPGCEPDEDGNFPIPCMYAATNPVGPYFSEYRKAFRDKSPISPPEGARRDKRGRWWVLEAGEWRLIFNPDDWFYVHSTVLDNPHMLAKDPAIYERLNALPEDMRQKMLFGSMDAISGQYYDCFSPNKHVINLRKDPDAIRWQQWQPIFIGFDWGRAHAAAIIWMTLADVLILDGTYRQKVVVYRELVLKGRTGRQLADELIKLSGKEKISAIYFSHEQFSKKWEQHSPADELSRQLREAGLPSVSKGTQLRAERAVFLYEKLAAGEFVVLDICPQVIAAIPACVRNDKKPEDVLKVPTDADDVYDALSMGLFGQLGNRPKPESLKTQERIASIKDPFTQRLAIMRQQYTEEKKAQLSTMPSWQRRLEERK